MILDAWLVFAVLLGVFIGFAREVASPDLLAMGGASVLLVLGVLEVEEMLGVFSNSGPLTIGAMFVLGAALSQTGVIGWLGSYVKRLAALPVPIALLMVMLFVMAASAFVNNTAVVVVLTPVVIALARSLDRTPSRFLIPLSYASIFGGTCTLVGTSTNLLVNGVASDHGLAEFTMFELTLPALVMATAGIAYMTLIGRHLLPDRETFSEARAAGEELEPEAEDRYLTELLLTDASPLVGERLRDLGSDESEILALVRDGESTEDPSGEMRTQGGDRLVVVAPAGEAIDLHRSAHVNGEESDGISERDLARVGFETLRSESTVLREGVVGPGSRFAQRRVSTLNMRSIYDVRVMAVHRRQEDLDSGFGEIELRVGDTLLLNGTRRGFRRLFDSGDLIDLSEPRVRRARPAHAVAAVVTMAAVMLLATAEVLPIVALSLIGAVFVVAVGCITPQEAYRSIDWRILFLIFGMLGIGRAMQSSGATQLVVEGVRAVAADFGPWALLAVIYLLASAMTESVTNNAVAIIMTPLVIGLAEQLGLDPRPYVVALMFAASASFATPLGYQTNTFVYGAGNYRFVDFLRVGLPLNLITWVLAVLLIPHFWPF